MMHEKNDHNYWLKHSRMSAGLIPCKSQVIAYCNDTFLKKRALDVYAFS